MLAAVTYTLGCAWWSCSSSHKDSPMRSSQLCCGRTVRVEFATMSTATQLPHSILVPSWSENRTLHQIVSSTRSWLFLAVRTGEHNRSTHHHHHQPAMTVFCSSILLYCWLLFSAASYPPPTTTTKVLLLSDFVQILLCRSFFFKNASYGRFPGENLCGWLQHVSQAGTRSPSVVRPTASKHWMNIFYSPWKKHFTVHAS